VVERTAITLSLKLLHTTLEDYEQANDGSFGNSSQRFLDSVQVPC
jgi:hypothetical protein